MARAWPRLEHIADEITPQQSCDVGLLMATIVLKPSYQDKWCLVKRISPSTQEQT